MLQHPQAGAEGGVYAGRQGAVPRCAQTDRDTRVLQGDISMEIINIFFYVFINIFFDPQVPREQCSPVTKEVPREECKVGNY